MTLTNEEIGLAIKIDDYVTKLYANGGTDEDLLRTMYDYMPLSRKLLDTAMHDETDKLCQQYAGFYTSAKLLEDMAGAIRDGVISVPPE
jgi:hypothetical protein